MIICKFGIGEQIRHKLLGYPGVVIDIDPEYSLVSPAWEELDAHDTLRSSPWYHVVMEDEQGQAIHTYLAEAQLMQETPDNNRHSSLSLWMSLLKRSSSERLAYSINAGRDPVHDSV